MSSGHGDELSEKGSYDSEPIPQDDDTIPNGGLLAWLQVVGTFFLFFNVSGITNSFGVFQTCLLYTSDAADE